MSKNIALLFSGGVDSSVCLKKIKDDGYNVTAFYIKIWLEDELKYLGNCPWEEDINFVSKTCKDLGVKFEVVSLQKEYWRKVVNESIQEIKHGLTPNPDIWCNEKIKFGSFLDKVGVDFDKIASGHYANVEEKNGKIYLKKSKDSFKDQTYFLSRLSQLQLKKIMFPIGNMTKKEVRDFAEKNNLYSKNRHDSQGICFLGKIKFSEFLKENIGEKKGDIIDRETGNKLGVHKGFWFYTMGQRQGLGLSGGPYFVVEKNIEENIIFVSKSLPVNCGNNFFEIINCNWIPELPKTGLYDIKIRHGEKTIKGEFIEQDNRYFILLSSKDRGLAEGQSAVLYKDEYCLGGGIIKNIMLKKS